MIDMLHPGLLLLMGAVLMAVLPNKFTRFLMPAAAIIALLSVLTMTAESKMVLHIMPTLSLQLMKTDRLSMAFTFIFTVGAVLAGIYNCSTKNRFEAAAETAYAGSAISVVLAGDWISMLVFWELMAIASWLVVISARTKAATKAGFRYLLIHMLGGNLLLVGIIMKIAEGSFDVTCLTDCEDAAYWLILAGTAVNAAIPPLHAWMPDAYPESTVGGSVYLGTYTTKVGIYALIRIFAGTEFLIYFGVFMALFGALMALLENNLRRLFSYHIISQLGYMLVSLALGTPMGIDGAVCHVFGNILYKGTLFMCAGAIETATGKRKITEMGGLYRQIPMTAVCMLIASLAICGFPGFSGFVSKGLIMNAIAECEYPAVELLMLLASVGTLLSVGLKVNYFVFFAKPSEQNEKSRIVDTAAVTLNMRAAMLLGTAACFLTGILPKLMQGLTPFASDGHPYTADHVTQYLELFAAATIVFVICLSKMKPHEGITLDIDWFYRRPLSLLINVISKGYLLLAQESRRIAADMVKLASDLVCKTKAVPHGLEEDDVLQKPAGTLLARSTVILIAIIIAAFIFLN